MKYMCPVCMYQDLPYPPRDYHICPCCGTEFGNDDADQTPRELREAWLSAGAPWFFGQPPIDWSAEQQLYNAGIGFLVSDSSPDVSFTVAVWGPINISMPDSQSQEQFSDAVA